MDAWGPARLRVASRMERNVAVRAGCVSVCAMLTRLHVQGYKALRNIDTTLEPLTVIVGPNGCGKTSVLESIAMVRDFLIDRNEAPKVYPLEELRSGGEARLDVEVALWARFEALTEESGKPPGQTRIKLSPKPEQSLISIEWDPPRRKGLRDPHRPKANHDIRAPAYLRSARLLAFDVKALGRPSYLRDVVPKIEDDGSGLATVLSTLIGEHREKFDEIQSQLREFVPEIERIFIRPAPISVVEAQDVPVGLDQKGKEILSTRHYQRDVIGNEIFFDYRHAKGVRAKHASEGTLLLLGLLTVARTADVSVLLLDDVDRALHPKAQQQLVGYLRKLPERGMQVIATSHSPYLVLHLEYDEVRAMTSADDGARIGKLTDHPEYERWREDMTPSEFWTVFGEEWLAKAKSKADDHG